MVPPYRGCGWQTTAAKRASRSSGSSSRASSLPAGPASVTDSIRRATLIGAEIDELQIDPEIGAANQLNGGLERVAVLAGDAHEIALNRSLDLQLAVLDLLDDVLGLLRGDALLHGDFLPHGLTRRSDDLAILQALERNRALDQLGLENFHHGLQLVFILAMQQDLGVLFLELDGGAGVLEVEALLDLFQRLLHGVMDLGHFDFGNYVKAV